jgi:hypothetical protein
MDPRNQMSMAAVASALQDDDKNDFSPELFFNTDVTSVMLEDHDDAVYLVKGSKKKLAQERRSVSTTKNKSQRRSLSFMTTTSAAGELLCTIVLLKDSNFEKLELFEVSV